MMRFDNTEFNLGVVKYGETATAVVNVSNLYNTDVTLEATNSSCSCTTGKLKDIKLTPNQKTQFIISLNTIKAGKGMNQVKSIALSYIVNREKHSQVFRIKINIV